MLEPLRIAERTAVLELTQPLDGAIELTRVHALRCRFATEAFRVLATQPEFARELFRRARRIHPAVVAGGRRLPGRHAAVGHTTIRHAAGARRTVRVAAATAVRLLAALLALALSLALLLALFVSHALAQRLQPLHQCPCALQRAFLRARRRLARHRARGRPEPIRHVLQILADLSFELRRVLGRATANHLLAEVDLVGHPRVTNGLRRFTQLARRLGLITTRFTRQPIGVGFECAYVLPQRILLLAQPPLLFVARVRRRALHLLHTLGDLLLTRLEIARAVGQLLHPTIELVGARALEIARGPVQLFERGIALSRRPARRPTHGIGRLLQALRSVAEFRVVLLARQALQPTRLFFGLTRQLTLRPAVGLLSLRALLTALLSAATARRRTATAARRATALLLAQPLTHRFGLTLHSLVFLLLPLGELPQLPQRFVDRLLRALLRLRLLLHGFVLVAQLVILQFEQVGQIFRLLSASATTTTAAAATAHLYLHVAVQRFGALQMLQGLLLEWQRISAATTSQLFLGQLHRSGGRFRFHADLGEHRVAGRQTALF